MKSFKPTVLTGCLSILALTLKVVESPHESSLEMSFPIKIP